MLLVSQGRNPRLAPQSKAIDRSACAQVSVDVPDQKGRLAILKVHAKNKKVSEEVELAQVAMRTPGFSGADLANLLNEVMLQALLMLCYSPALDITLHCPEGTGRSSDSCKAKFEELEQYMSSFCEFTEAI